MSELDIRPEVIELERQLCDELALRLEPVMPWGDTVPRTIKYRRPRAILPENCPLLCVWVMRERIEPQTNTRYETTVWLGASWHEASVDSAETLQMNPERALSLMQAVSAIKGVTMRLGVSGWDVPGASEVWPTSVSWQGSMGNILDTGLVEGYAVEIQVRAKESGRDE